MVRGGGNLADLEDWSVDMFHRYQVHLIFKVLRMEAKDVEQGEWKCIVMKGGCDEVNTGCWKI